MRWHWSQIWCSSQPHVKRTLVFVSSQLSSYRAQWESESGNISLTSSSNPPKNVGIMKQGGGWQKETAVLQLFRRPEFRGKFTLGNKISHLPFDLSALCKTHHRIVLSLCLYFSSAPWASYRAVHEGKSCMMIEIT